MSLKNEGTTMRAIKRYYTEIAEKRQHIIKNAQTRPSPIPRK
jgi:hypothetical protein